MRTQIRPALVALAWFTLLTGVAYPLAVTGLAQLLFPSQANGSLIQTGEGSRGSALIGQPFNAPGYFWSRPSATGPAPYNAAASTGSNLGPISPVLDEAVRGRVAALRGQDPAATGPVPVDLVTASGSGLDPHISPAAARYQAARVARARGIHADSVLALVTRHTEPRQLGFLGEPRVNVLRLNLALDGALPAP